MKKHIKELYIYVCVSTLPLYNKTTISKEVQFTYGFTI